MAIATNTQCKTCGTGRPPAGGRYCRTCGRRIGWTETPAGRRRAWVAAGVAAAVVTILGVVALAAVRSSGPAVMARPTVAMAAPVEASPSPTPIPVAPPVSAGPKSVEPTLVPAAPPSVPVRAGDVDLSIDPLSVYAGGPSADRLTVHGIRLGLAVADVPGSRISTLAADHMTDVDGNLYAVDDGRVTEIHVRDRNLLARWPIDGTHALFARFGVPADTYRGDGDAAPTFLYPDRGIHVSWDGVDERIREIVLVRPNAH